MSHRIPDVTKMLDETPCEATPREELRNQIMSSIIPKNEREWWAKRTIEQLERELNVANERIKNLESALSTVENINKVNTYQDLESANERIKRLEEAGDEMHISCSDRLARRIWTAAKEAKP